MDYKTTSVSPATVWEHTTQHVCFPSAHQDHSPGRGYYVSCLYTHKSTCLLLGCIPQSRVDITRWKKQPVHLESHKSHGSWLVLYADTITLVHFTIENKWGKRASLGQCPFQSIQSDWDRTAASECSGKSTGWSHRLFQASAPCVTHQWVQRSVLCLANVQIIIPGNDRGNIISKLKHNFHLISATTQKLSFIIPVAHQETLFSPINAFTTPFRSAEYLPLTTV